MPDRSGAYVERFITQYFVGIRVDIRTTRFKDIVQRHAFIFYSANINTVTGTGYYVLTGTLDDIRGCFQFLVTNNN